MNLKNKYILDCTCGARYFWYLKKHPNAIYTDNRHLPRGSSKQRKNFSVEPDLIADFRSLPFARKSFKLVIFDPPHLYSLGKKADMAIRYGRLNKGTWKEDLQQGFSECWRVLDDFGVLAFRWNDFDIALKDLLNIIPEKPLIIQSFGKKTSTTYWMLFMKIPEEVSGE